MMTRRQALVSLLGLVCSPVVGAAQMSGRTPSEAQARWFAFRERFVTADGRVIDTGNGGIAHTEGQGVAMLAAATLKDEETFARLWTFTRSMQREDGLFSWKFVPGQGIADRNNATDGDLYIAWALARAAETFAHPEYRHEAVRIASAVRSLCLVKDPHGLVILPGVQGFDSPDGKTPVVVNPAYWIFPALTACAALDPSGQWAECIRTGQELLGHAQFGRFQLPADWLLLSDPVQPWPARPARFGYEAIRIPLFLFWSGQLSNPCLQRFAAFARTPGFPAWIGFDNTSQANYAAPAGFEAVARLARAAVFGQPVTVPDLDTDYFSASLTLLSALATNEVKIA